MLIATNLILIAFVLVMAYWWSVQGFFSAFLHMCVTIVAAALALAIWEPLVIKFLLYRMPPMAWTMGLLIPFGVLLILLRGATNKMVPKNMHFQPILGMIGGGICGAASGVLSSGLVIIAFGFLPVGPAVVGYQPYITTASGQVAEAEDTLWLGVDQMAYRFFAKLSGGAFAPWSGTGLATHQPDLATRVAINRLSVDEHASTVAVPDTVEVSAMYTHAAPLPRLNPALAITLGDAFKNKRNKMLVVDTQWQQTSGHAGTYDTDGVARVSGTQIRLLLKSNQDNQYHIAEPRAFAKADGPNLRFFTPLDSDQNAAYAKESKEQIAWIFLVPDDQQAQYLFVRNLRLTLPSESTYERDPEAMVKVLGLLADSEQAAEAAAKNTPSAGSAGLNQEHKDLGIQLTSKLPKPVSKNSASGLATDGNEIVEGKTVAPGGVGSLSKNTRIDSIQQPSHVVTVRIQFERERAQSLLGQARVSAAAVGPIFLRDSKGNEEAPIGYVWFKKASGEMEINVQPTTRIRSGKQIPSNKMESGDTLYLYFRVGKNRMIQSYHAGTTEQKLDLFIPAD